MGQADGLSNYFWLTTISSSIISFILGSVLTYFRKKWLVFVQIARSYIFNAPARVKIAIHIRRYPNQPETLLSPEIFKMFYDAMAEEGITKRSLGESSMRIYSEKLGLPLNVWLVEEPNLAGNQEEEPPQPYKVSVELDGELRIGYRNISDFQEFMTHSIVNLVCEEPSYAVIAIRKYFPL